MNSPGFTVFLHVMIAIVMFGTYYFMKEIIGLNRIWRNFFKMFFFGFYIALSPLLLPDSWIYVNQTTKDALNPHYEAYWTISQAVFVIFVALGLIYLVIMLLWRSVSRW